MRAGFDLSHVPAVAREAIARGRGVALARELLGPEGLAGLWARLPECQRSNVLFLADSKPSYCVEEWAELPAAVRIDVMRWLARALQIMAELE